MKKYVSILFLAVLLAGCATTPKIDWNSRLNNYTFDMAVRELGVPDRAAQLSDGSTVNEWLISRGGYYSSPGFYGPWYGPYGYYRPYYGYYGGYDIDRFPDRWLRLTFNNQGQLKAWQKFSK